MPRFLTLLLCVFLMQTFVIAQENTPKPKPETLKAEPEAPKDPPEPEDKAEKNETIDDVLKRIEKKHKEHKDFRGDFAQTKYLPLFDDKVESSGVFVFKKPDSVRWEYKKPHQSILVVAEGAGKKWSATTKKIESFKLTEDRALDAVVSQMFTWFKGEFTKLADDYDITKLDHATTRLQLAPKKAGLKKFISAIEVTFNDDESRLVSVKLIEPLKDGDEQSGYTLYKFENTKLDSKVQDTEFEINK
ncbi:outer membrane lipoprotein carrier protein LolA [Planctomycetota bacterium]|nr:outer membrane lipoprotein carrier protein LolA [Planctomycetota bacterium]